MTSSDYKPGGPMMQLLASGLKLWVRQQCQAIGSLDIRLQGTALQLLRGRLAGVQLLARRVIYKGLHFELVELSSGPVQVHSGNLLKGQPLQLEQAFEIQGQVSLTAEGLTHALSAPQWRALGDGLGEALLGIVPLVELRMCRDNLVFAARALGAPDLVELATTVLAAEGSIEIRSLDGNVSSRLPMDPGITISDARLEAGMVQLIGKAQVSP